MPLLTRKITHYHKYLNFKEMTISFTLVPKSNSKILLGLFIITGISIQVKTVNIIIIIET